MSSKRFKDPVYGYIDIPEDLCASFVDTAGFQRLRRVAQTGYAPLYPSALHNRFVHSLGVYHLGCIASDALDRSVRQHFDDGMLLRRWAEALSTFRIACLLHDFGHSPFSHAGENFYIIENPYLNEDLVEAVGNEEFEADASDRSKSDLAAPHEVMSALLALRAFGDMVGDKALFARCITGYKHLNPCSNEDHLENILIETLHSSTIDVDRLDYLIRDAFVVGFESISIDYERLLKSLRVVKVSDGYQRCFYRSALSVLENVIYARDLEKQWIQAHPVVLYEQALVQGLIAKVNARELGDGAKLFVEDALTCAGVSVSGDWTVRLMSDDDIVVLAKQNMDDPMIGEYFDRGNRRHPVWKSEAEYKMLFRARMDEQELQVVEKLEKVMANLIDLFGERGQLAVLDEAAIMRLESELEMLEDACNGKGGVQERNKRRALVDQLRLLKWLRDYSDDHGLDFDFAVLSTKNFSSGFLAGDIGREKVVFDDEVGAKWSSFSKVASGLSANNEAGRTFFLFRRRREGEQFDKWDFANHLVGVFDEM